MAPPAIPSSATAVPSRDSVAMRRLRWSDQRHPRVHGVPPGNDEAVACGQGRDGGIQVAAARRAFVAEDCIAGLCRPVGQGVKAG